MKLYLDDIRNPKEKDWIVVRNYYEFKEFILREGLPSIMSLDHDLGGIYSGLDCVKWLVYEKGFDLRDVDIYIHSANPVGRSAMEGLIENWNKWLDEEDLVKKG